MSIQPDEGTLILPPEIRNQIRALSALSVLLIAAMLGYALHRHSLQNNHRPEEVRVVASVNGEDIKFDEFDAALREAGGTDVLRQLVREKIILEEARRDHVTADDPESQRRLDVLSRRGSGVMVARDAKAAVLLRKVLLKDVPESRKRHLYDLFKNELTQYDVSGILVQTQAEAQNVEASVKAGTGFDQVAVPVDPTGRQTRASIESVTLAGIEARLGRSAADVISRLHPGAVSAPIAVPSGFLIVKVGAIRSQYDDLKPAVEDLIAQAGRKALLYRLTSQAKITSVSTNPGTPAPAASQGG